MLFAMHIPDGFVSLPVSSVFWLLALVMVGLALRVPNRGPASLAGLLGAFVFAAQALNFPVGIGTSGHLVGSALLTVVVGPWAALLIVTCVLSVQCLLFQDGGILALGCNIFNMAVLPSFVTSATMGIVGGILGRNRPRTLLVGAGLAGWLSVQFGAISCSLMLAISGTSLLGPTIFSMLAVHIPIGLVEGLITMSTVGFLVRTRPDLMAENAGPSRSGIGIGVGLSVALALALASPLACTSPDGLDSVASQLGFAGRTQASPWEIFPDYKLPFITYPALGTALAVSLGTLIVFMLAWLMAGRLAGKSKPKSSSDQALHSTDT